MYSSCLQFGVWYLQGDNYNFNFFSSKFWWGHIGERTKKDASLSFLHIKGVLYERNFVLRKYFLESKCFCLFIFCCLVSKKKILFQKYFGIIWGNTRHHIWPDLHGTRICTTTWDSSSNVTILTYREWHPHWSSDGRTKY